MAARSKKRLSKIENKLNRLDKLELKDVLCSICQSILVEPVTLPCYHDFCRRCFNGSIENNALCCPLCRLRIGSWLRTTTKRNNLINAELWNFIQTKFSSEVEKKVRGDEDIDIDEEKPLPRLSAPGEIRLEYEAELKRLRLEQMQLEQKHFKETEQLIKKLQLEEEDAHKKYLDALKHDEQLARQVEREQSSISLNASKKLRLFTRKSRIKATPIENFLTKNKTIDLKDSPLLTDDNTSTDSSLNQANDTKHTSPQPIPTYGKLIKNFFDKKVKTVTLSLWNKENGKCLEKDVCPLSQNNDKPAPETYNKLKNPINSLLVSLPLPSSGILQKTNMISTRDVSTSSTDSMRQEIIPESNDVSPKKKKTYFFEPIEPISSSLNGNKEPILRVPVLRVRESEKKPLRPVNAPNRLQYLESLCRLRGFSLARNLPSAFVIVLKALKDKEKSNTVMCTRNKLKRGVCTSPFTRPEQIRKNTNFKSKPEVQVDGITKLQPESSLRRTRSMGSITKISNETTPQKKTSERKVCSERKPFLRSMRNSLNTSPFISATLNNNKINLAVKNISSPLESCDVNKILQEQMRIEKIIEQEKKDFELARKIEAEWNGRRQPRRTAIKRQVSINDALRPAKKLKV